MLFTSCALATEAMKQFYLATTLPLTTVHTCSTVTRVMHSLFPHTSGPLWVTPCPFLHEAKLLQVLQLPWRRTVSGKLSHMTYSLLRASVATCTSTVFTSLCCSLWFDCSTLPPSLFNTSIHNRTRTSCEAWDHVQEVCVSGVRHKVWYRVVFSNCLVNKSF